MSERLAPSQGMLISAPTLLRRLRAVACPPPKSVRILGVDDWAWKKGQTYGTILVDLEKRCPIELLADRKEETLTAWLLTHPEIEVISRDRGGEYAAAAKKGAPQAQQIADKFHILKNLRDGLKELMARKQKVLPEVEELSSDAIGRLTQGNDRRMLFQKYPSQMSLRSTGGRCHKSHATSPLDQRMSRLPRLGARCRAPIATAAMRPFKRSISRPSPRERLLAVCTCPAT